MRRRLALYGALLVLGAIAAVTVRRDHAQAVWHWDLPPGFPAPRIPADNPMSAAKVDLGRLLFYDKQLSNNRTQSCASCHQQRRAFTDGRVHAIGSTGEAHRRNSMTLTNVAYASRLTWAHPLLDRIEAQVLLPMFGDAPIELGLPDATTLLTRLRADPNYVARFTAAFPQDADSITVTNVTCALACFVRTLISGNSAYDRYTRGDQQALSAAAKRGMELFFSERLECFHCHGNFNFADAVDHAKLAEPERAFHNTGLYNVDGKGSYPSSDGGLYEITRRWDDMGRFKAPTLRNVAVTAPYMHDGSIATLEEVLDHYAAGGRTIASGPNAGDGHTSPLKEKFVAGFILTPAERADVIAFLQSLTDEAFLADPRFADPFGSRPAEPDTSSSPLHELATQRAPR
ncbi:MAG TPA: di-heme enzyme [Candidatus Margulisiibacteriota bacterium]|nr:di-heme enzyme [Candidatus Margulisiibacteriota bacterium]